MFTCVCTFLIHMILAITRQQIVTIFTFACTFLIYMIVAITRNQVHAYTHTCVYALLQWSALNCNIDNGYEIDRQTGKLGSGSFSTVWKGEHI